MECSSSDRRKQREVDNLVYDRRPCETSDWLLSGFNTGFNTGLIWWKSDDQTPVPKQRTRQLLLG